MHISATADLCICEVPMPQSLTLPLGAQERQRGAQTRRPLTVELPVSSSLRPNPTGGPHRRARWRAFGPVLGAVFAESPSLVPAGEAAAGDAVAGVLCDCRWSSTCRFPDLSTWALTMRPRIATGWPPKQGSNACSPDGPETWRALVRDAPDWGPDRGRERVEEWASRTIGPAPAISSGPIST